MENCIAVLDDGVSKDVVDDLLFDFEVKSNGRVMIKKQKTDMSSHGSICAAIIRRYAPEAKIGSIKILNSERKGNIRALLVALRWCAKRGIKIVNLSAGTYQMCDIIPLIRVVKAFRRRGGILVAACKNGKNIGFPASLDGVIGVKAVEGLKDDEYYMCDEQPGGIDYIASGEHHLSIMGIEETTIVSNSYAAPVISAHLYKALNENKPMPKTNIKTADKQINGADYMRGALVELAGIALPESEVRPVIACLGKKSAKLAYKLAHRFLSDGYLPLVCSCKAEECYSENLRIDSTRDLDDRLQRLAVYCDADLIIAVLGESPIQNHLHKDAIVIGRYARRIYANEQETLTCGLLNSIYRKVKQMITE